MPEQPEPVCTQVGGPDPSGGDGGEDPPHLLYERRGPVAVLKINRPERANAMTPRMHQETSAAWAQVRDDPSVRVAVITGAGDRHFSTGADLQALAEAGGTAWGVGRFADEVRWSHRAHGVNKPVIAAVNGVVAGGGLHFVVDADIIVASETATFMDTHANVGLVAGTEMVGLTKRLPIGSVLRMALMGRDYRMSAARAHALGLVDEVVVPGDLAATVQSMAEVIARNSPDAMAVSLQALWGSLEMPHSAALEYGWALVRAHASHPDATEGPAAFMERREPRWLAPRPPP